MQHPTESNSSQSSATFGNSGVQKASEFLLRRLNIPEADRPKTAVILGSGLGAAADRLISCGGTSIAFAEIPGMPRPHVTGHAGRLVAGRIAGVTVAMLQGRVHFYEGHSPEAIVFGVQLLLHMGIERLIVTNAAGGIRKHFIPGDLMLISDHLRPLAAAELKMERLLSGNTAAGRNRSLETCLWNANLRSAARQVPTELRIHEGVYAMMTGPTYETPSEIRMLRTLGADAVGMSTVPEALFAAAQGVRVLGISCITNMAAGLSDQLLDHSEVTATASSIEARFVDWLWELLQRLSLQDSVVARAEDGNTP